MSAWIEDEARAMCGCRLCRAGGPNCNDPHKFLDIARGIRAGLEKAAEVPRSWPQGPACDAPADVARAYHESARWIEKRIRDLLK